MEQNGRGVVIVGCSQMEVFGNTFSNNNGWAIRCDTSSVPESAPIQGSAAISRNTFTTQAGVARRGVRIVVPSYGSVAEGDNVDNEGKEVECRLKRRRVSLSDDGFINTSLSEENARVRFAVTMAGLRL